jgi:hypothetical protein
MKIETYLWITIGLFALSAIVGLTFLLKEKEVFGKKILKISGTYIFIIYFLLIQPVSFTNYNLRNEQNLWKKYGLAQIDSCMFLQYQTNDFYVYDSWSDDNVSHIRKHVEYDVFDIYSIEDVFRNIEESKTLKYYFIKPNILRDSSLIVTINNDTISKKEGDKLLKDWGIYKRAYQLSLNR